MSVTTPSVTDFDQFARLRAAARADDPEALRATAKQFEALFTQQLLKSMRAASPGDDIFGGEQSEFYRDLYDQQLAMHLSAGKGLGIADMMLRQLQQAQSPSSSATSTTSVPRAAGEGRGGGVLASAAAGSNELPHPVERLRRPTPPPTAEGAVEAKELLMPRYGVATVAYTDDDVPAAAPIPLQQASAPASQREAFVQKLRPHAEQAARELGISPHTLIAQAALETGWGRHVIRKSDGSSSLNFFGIKADKAWNGERTRSATTEYMNGQKTSEAAQFRAYGSIAEAFTDYVRFIKANPRYHAALDHNGSDLRYMQGLQNAGYATDPQYAAKIHRVSSSSLIHSAASGPRLLSL